MIETPFHVVHSPLELFRQADLPWTMGMALVAVEVVVDFGIAQRAEPAVVLVVVVVDSRS